MYVKQNIGWAINLYQLIFIYIIPMKLDQAHDQVEPPSPTKLSKVQMEEHQMNQQHSKAGQFVKSAVYGGLDGIITTLSIALSGVGAASGATTIVAIGLASLIADGLSMGIADYLATKSDDQFMKGQQERQRQQIQKDFEAQKQQMVHLYQEMGLQPKVSEEIVQIISSNREGFLKIMMIQQLHLIAGQQSPFLNSVITFFSFAIFGLLPLIPYIVAEVNNLQINYKYAVIAIAISFADLFVIGFGKSFVTSAKWYASATQTIIIGFLSAGVAYGIGAAFNA